MGYLSNRVDKNELEAGDHIYTWRTGFIYSHHGIYMGEGKVIHFTEDNISRGSSLSTPFSSPSSNYTSTFCRSCEALRLRKKTSGVIESCLDCFLENGSLYRFEYGVNIIAFTFQLRDGTCSHERSDAAYIVINRAMRLLENRFGKYDVLRNNFEDFAMYCKTGHGCNPMIGSQAYTCSMH